MPQFKVIIIGSGLAGSLLANGLIHNNIEVSVYERLERNSKREGYQIRLGAPALQGFRTCLKKEQIDALVQKFGRANGSRSSAPVIYDHRFNEMLNLAQFPVYSKSAPINRVILRDALAEPVHEAGKLKYEKAFDRYEILNAGNPDEGVRVWFADGSFEDCDILVGADGSHSKINRQIGLNNIHQIASHISMVAKNELPTSRFLGMSQALQNSPVMSFSDRKVIYFCAYLPDKLGMEVDSTKDNFDEGLSSSMFGAHVPVEHCPPDLADKSTKEKWEFVSQAFRSWSPEYQEILDLVRGSDLYVYKGRASKPPPRNWRTKVQTKQEIERGHPRVWLIGDAMHAMLPNRGQGGNQSMRDTATVLPLLIRLSEGAQDGHRPSTGEVQQALHEYEAEMIPRAFAWVRKSGGTAAMPIDAATLKGRIFFFLAARIMTLLFFWSKFVGLFSRNKNTDDAPELQT